MTRKKWRQKITSFLVIMAMVTTCISPLGATAAEPSYAQDAGANIKPGKAVYKDMGLISGYDSTARSYDYIWFGNYKDGTDDKDSMGSSLKWRVLDDQTNTEEKGYFLLACGSVDNIYFEKTGDPIGSGADIWGNLITGNQSSIDSVASMYNEYGYNTLYGQSDARMWCSDFAGVTIGSYKWDDGAPSAFTGLEQAAILSTSKSDSAYTSEHNDDLEHPFMGYNNILNNDKVFLPSAEEVYDEAYGIKENVKIWTLLRSYPLPYTANALEIGEIKEDQIFVLNAFEEVFSGPFSEEMQNWARKVAVTPAFNLAPDKALFTMAADNSGQVDFGPAENYDGSEWKLTLKDGNNFANGAAVSANTTLKAGDSLTVTHKALNSVNADYTNVTAALIDENGNVCAYGSINSDTAAKSSTFTIPAGCEDGTYTLMISGEDWNAAYNTNYATGTPFETTIVVDTPHKHENKTSKKAIYTKDDLLGISEAGFYHLVRDIDLGEDTWTPADGVVLCLNGYEISGTSEEVVKVTSGTFTVEDCKNSGQIVGAKGSALSCTGSGKCDISGGGFSGEYGVRLTDGGEAYLHSTPAIDGTMADFYVDSDSRIWIAAILSGTPKYTVHMDVAGIFTKGWNTYMSSANMGDFFAMKDSHLATLEKDTISGELKLVGITQHYICGASCDHGTDGEVKNDHIMSPDTEWIKLTQDYINSNTTLTDGNYYLAESIEVNTAINVTGDALLCLNGNAITQTALSSTIVVNNGAHLTLCDCSEEQTGAIKNKVDNLSGTGVTVSGTLDMYGGQIAGFYRDTDGAAGVRVSGTFNMYGGSIHDNKLIVKNAYFGAGVYVTTNANFNMYGGSITNNTLEANYRTDYTDKPANGGGVYVYDGNFRMYGGEISGNRVNYTGSNTTLRSKGGGVYVEHYEYNYYGTANFKMYGGTITNNTADNYGGGVWIESGTMTVSGNPQIYGNKNESGIVSNVGVNTVSATNKGKINVDGPLTNATPIGIHIPGIDAVSPNIAAEDYIFGTIDTNKVSNLVEAASHFKGDHLYKFRPNYGVSVTDNNKLKLTLPEIVQQPTADNDYTVLTNLDSDVTSYQWKRNGSVVASETGKTLKNYSSGETWQCVITMKWAAPGGQAETVILTTNSVTTQEKLTGNVSVSGTTEVGKTLTASITGSNGGNTLKYNWYREGSADSLGTGKTYKLTTNDYNKNITCKVTSSQYPGEISDTVGPIKQGTPDIGAVTANELNDTLDVEQVTLSRADTSIPGELELTDNVLQYGTNTYNWKFTPNNDAYKTITGTVFITVKDTIAPTAKYQVNDSQWREFVNFVSFGIFCKDTAVLKVDAADSGSGVDFVKYYVSTSKVEDTSTITAWKDYGIINPVELNEKSANHIYVQVKDNAGNTVIYEEGVVVYTESAAKTTEVEYSYKEGKDKEILVDFNGNTVKSIITQAQNPLTRFSGSTLTKGSDYAVENDRIILKKEYLDTLNASDTAYSFQVKYYPVGIDTEQVNIATNFNVKVSKADLDPANGAVTASGTYGAKLSELTVSGPDVTSNGKKVDGEWVLTGDTAPEVGDTGNYTAKFVPEKDADNYNELTKKVVLNIAKANATYTAPIAKTGLKYQTEVSQELISEGFTEHGTMKYAIGASSTSAPENGWSTDIPEGKKADTYYVWYKVFGDKNHKDSEAGCIEVSIAKTNADNVTLPAKEYVYTVATNGNEVDLTANIPADRGETTYKVDTQNSKLSDNIKNVEVDGNGKLTYDTADASAPVDGLYITVTVTSENYNDFTVKLPIKLSDKEKVTVNLPIAQSGTYNNESHTGYTGTPSVSDHNVAFDITYEGIGSTQYPATTDKPVNAGDYKVTFTVKDNRVQGSASLEFSIFKGTPVLKNVEADTLENTTDLNEIKVTYQTENWSEGKLTIDNNQTLAYGNNSLDYTFTPNDTKNLNNVSGKVEVQVNDTISPSAEISAAGKQWKEFLNSITFGLLFNNKQQVTITYADNQGGSGLKEMLYYVSDKGLTEDELKTVTWKSYNGEFSIDPDGEYVIYAKAVDNYGNSVIVNSDGIKLDATKPLLSGISDGEVYYGDLTIQTSEEHQDVKDVEVDGVPVEFENGKYTLAADNGMHTIVVTDNAGNETTYNITVFKIYDVTFIVDGVEYLKVQVNHGANAQLPEIPHKAGYDKTAPTWDHDGKSITEDTEINALYIKNPPEESADTGDDRGFRLWGMMVLISMGLAAAIISTRKKYN